MVAAARLPRSSGVALGGRSPCSIAHSRRAQLELLSLLPQSIANAIANTLTKHKHLGIRYFVIGANALGLPGQDARLGHNLQVFGQVGLTETRRFRQFHHVHGPRSQTTQNLQAAHFRKHLEIVSDRGQNFRGQRVAILISHARRGPSNGVGEYASVWEQTGCW